MPGPGQQDRDFSEGRNALYPLLSLLVLPWHYAGTVTKTVGEGVLSVSEGLLLRALYEDADKPRTEDHKGKNVSGGCLCFMYRHRIGNQALLL